MKKHLYVLILLVCGLISSCSEENNMPLKTTTNAPAPLTENDVSWQPISGGAVIKYNTPMIANIRGIEARYQLETGQSMTIKGSFLSDSLVIEGYQTDSEKTIELFVVDNSDNYSAPYSLIITPNKSQISQVQESLEVIPDFGGMQISWKNIDKKPIALFVSRVEENEKVLIEQYYSDQANPTISIRGELAEKSEYIVQIRDRWDNYSEELKYTLTPLFEKQVEHFSYMPYEYFHNIIDKGGMYNWFDGATSAPGWGDIHWPTQTPTMPHWSAIKLTNPTTLSRVVLWQYGWGANNYQQFYGGGNARNIEIYGSRSQNPETGDPAASSSWELIVACEIKMPSGSWINTGNNLTDEDFDVAKNRGHEFIIPLQNPVPAYTALSFKLLDPFQGSIEGGEGARLSEIQLFGDDRPTDSK